LQRLLLLDDDPSILKALQRELRPPFARVLTIDACTSGDEALLLGELHFYDLVVSDLRMPVMDGMTFLRRFAKLQPNSVRLMLTGSADFATAQQAVNQLGVYRYLTKPWTTTELVDHMHSALDHARAEQKRRESASSWEASRGLITPQEAERRRLEAIEPGLTRVERDEHGFVIMPSLDEGA
jgi:two-component system probable response regulator PhcQ